MTSRGAGARIESLRSSQYDLFDLEDDFGDELQLTEGGTQLLAPPFELTPVAFFSTPARQALADLPTPAQPAQGSLAAEAVGTTNTADLFDMPTDQKVDRALGAIDQVMEAGHPLAVAYSGGKDSSVMLALVVEAARRRKEAGLPVPRILVTHANTGIENPAMHLVVMSEIDRIRQYAAQNDLPIQVDIATPSMNDTWAVRIISGRALPTFANSSSRDCSISWKITPQRRQRKKVFAELLQAGQPVTMTGTRFDESTGRGVRMTDRGEMDNELWAEDVHNKDGKLVRSELRLSPIAYWTQEDIWVFLGQLSAGQRKSYTDAEDIWEVYRDGGNSSCAVVSDDTMKANAKACGARFGCSLCTAVGRDKSLEAMLEADKKYSYLIPLNKLQRFLVDTQYDLDRRLWVGRSINEQGFIAIKPDSYGPEMQRELLRYALSIDAVERVAAARLGIRPRFELVSDQQLIAIDAIWSMQGYHPRPFEAIHIWEDVVINGNHVLPPEVDTSKFTKKIPDARYLYVGADWDDDPSFDKVYTGARHLLSDFSGASDSAGCQGNVELGDGRVVMGTDKSDFFNVDEEGAQMFLAYEVLDAEVHKRSEHYGPSHAFNHYQLLGTFSTSLRHLGDQDSALRRAAWKRRHNVFEMSREQILSLTVSKAEMQAGQHAPEGMTSLRAALLQRTEAEQAERAEKTRQFHIRMGWVNDQPPEKARDPEQTLESAERERQRA